MIHSTPLMRSGSAAAHTVTSSSLAGANPFRQPVGQSACRGIVILAKTATARTIMAEAILTHLTSGKIPIVVAPTLHDSVVHKMTPLVLEELGIDISSFEYKSGNEKDTSNAGASSNSGGQMSARTNSTLNGGLLYQGAMATYDVGVAFSDQPTADDSVLMQHHLQEALEIEERRGRQQTRSRLNSSSAEGEEDASNNPRDSPLPRRRPTTSPRTTTQPNYSKESEMIPEEDLFDLGMKPMPMGGGKGSQAGAGWKVASSSATTKMDWSNYTIIDNPNASELSMARFQDDYPGEPMWLQKESDSATFRELRGDRYTWYVRPPAATGPSHNGNTPSSSTGASANYSGSGGKSDSDSLQLPNSSLTAQAGRFRKARDEVLKNCTALVSLLECRYQEELLVNPIAQQK